MLSTVELIQQMLAPGVMINACGLLLLGINNKYSIVVGRIRALEEERRRLLPERQHKNISDIEENRWKSITTQLDFFAKRIRFVRNCVALYASAIAFFLLTSFSIGMQAFDNWSINWTQISMICFLIGMIFVLVGVVYAVREVMYGYRVVQVELREIGE